ncbi:MAG TPA: hypothetical protein VFH61_18645, partial [Thermoleophilia bacterium]|nr:hypothetical protein [Thermoleophilia bacterium]
IQSVSMEGSDATDWVDLGPIAQATNAVEERRNFDFTKLVNIGCDVTVVDAANGVVSLGEQVFGSNGAVVQKTIKVRRWSPDDEIRFDFYSILRSQASDALSKEFGGKGVTLADLWFREQRCKSGKAPVPHGWEQEIEAIVTPEGGEEAEEPGGGETEETEVVEERECPPNPLGFPYLVLHAASPKRSTGDDRDYTFSYGQTGFAKADPLFSDRVLYGMIENIYTLKPVVPTPTGASSRGGAAEIWTYELPDVQLRCRSARMAGMTEQYHSFHRAGGYASGWLAGDNYWNDIELVARTDLQGRTRDIGSFYPVTRAHYDKIFSLFQDIVARVTASVLAYRKTGNHQRTLNAEIMGCRRDMFPGTSLFENNPFDSVTISGSGDGALAICRATSNSRGFRPYVGSAMERATMSYIASQAASLYGQAARNGGGM